MRVWQETALTGTRGILSGGVHIEAGVAPEAHFEVVAGVDHTMKTGIMATVMSESESESGAPPKQSTT